MATKFNLRRQVLRDIQTTNKAMGILIERIVALHKGDQSTAQLCVEGVIDILGTMYARMNAGKSVFDGDDARKRRILTGIVAGAKVMKDHPEAAEDHNLTAPSLYKTIHQTDVDTQSAQTMLTVANSAPSVVSEVVQALHRYETALQTGDTATIEEVKNMIQQLWLHWQRAVAPNTVEQTA